MSTRELPLPRSDPAPQLRMKGLWWLLGWGVVAFIAYATLSPARYVPELHLWDKAEHALAFFGMTLWFGGLTRRSRYPVIGVLMLAFGGSIEILQGAMKLGRDEDIMDFVADSVGISIALALLYIGLGAWTRWIEGLLWRSRES